MQLSQKILCICVYQLMICLKTGPHTNCFASEIHR